MSAIRMINARDTQVPFAPKPANTSHLPAYRSKTITSTPDRKGSRFMIEITKDMLKYFEKEKLLSLDGNVVVSVAEP